MRLLFIHGPPASGKFTIAEALRARHGVHNFHNHLTLDVARALFDFGSASFWDLVSQLRHVSLAAKAVDPHAVVSLTYCYSAPADNGDVRAIQHIVESKGGVFQPVYLECDLAELRRRVVEPNRRRMRKIGSVEGLDEFMAAGDFVAFAHPNTITLNTSGRAVEDCVDELVQALALDELGSNAG